ncbi:MAG: glycosyltransferase [Nitrospirae bacterium]|nr:glycosyltransferase [Nitrospirota bacterium]MDA1303999.1 glycosyltransferase [Nitrospirota bacterium]
MKPEINICIVIPCYNEGKRLAVEAFHSFFSESPQVLVCFVNDGSVDDTQRLLEKIQLSHPYQVEVVLYSNNVGKAEAVRRGSQHCNSRYDHAHIAYLDADLATSLQDCLKLQEYLQPPIEFCFGSRIRLLGTFIKRKKRRWLLGRVIATIISQMLRINVYDTQCGCKLFSKALSKELFQEEFISKWLFDVELFFRMITLYGMEGALPKMLEVPLRRWIDGDVSSVKVSYIFTLWLDLYQIHKTYSARAFKNSSLNTG